MLIVVSAEPVRNEEANVYGKLYSSLTDGAEDRTADPRIEGKLPLVKKIQWFNLTNSRNKQVKKDAT